MAMVHSVYYTRKIGTADCNGKLGLLPSCRAWNRRCARFNNLFMRLFVGIPLATTMCGELAALSTRLHAVDDGLRWSLPTSWHITLQFLGETSRTQYGCVVQKLRELKSPPVPVAIGELGFFDRVGIFFAGVRLAPELLLAQERVTTATGQCGFVAESRPYQAHITLARSKNRDSWLSFKKLKSRLPADSTFSAFVAEQFLLYESFLGAGGSRYEIRERFPLNS